MLASLAPLPMNLQAVPLFVFSLWGTWDVSRGKMFCFCPLPQLVHARFFVDKLVHLGPGSDPHQDKVVPRQALVNSP